MSVCLKKLFLQINSTKNKLASFSDNARDDGRKYSGFDATPGSTSRESFFRQSPNEGSFTGAIWVFNCLNEIFCLLTSYSSWIITFFRHAKEHIFCFVKGIAHNRLDNGASNHEFSGMIERHGCTYHGFPYFLFFSLECNKLHLFTASNEISPEDLLLDPTLKIECGKLKHKIKNLYKEEVAQLFYDVSIV